MITLLGGRHDGKYLNRDRLPFGHQVAIIGIRDAEVYRMRNDGCAEYVAPGDPDDRWHAVALEADTISAPAEEDTRG